jgi:hypothetical protein
VTSATLPLRFDAMNFASRLFIPPAAGLIKGGHRKGGRKSAWNTQTKGRHSPECEIEPIKDD